MNEPIDAGGQANAAPETASDLANPFAGLFPKDGAAAGGDDRGAGDAAKPDAGTKAAGAGSVAAAKAGANDPASGAKAAGSEAGGDEAKAAEAAKDGEGKDQQKEIDWQKVDLGLNGDADPALVESFRSLAREIGLSPEQAKSLAAFESGVVQKTREAMVARGAEVLKAEWGAEAGRKRDGCLALINGVDQALARTDPRLAGSFAAAISRSGVACDVDFIRGLSHIASLLREDSLDAIRGDAAFTREETPEEALREIFNKK